MKSNKMVTEHMDVKKAEVRPAVNVTWHAGTRTSSARGSPPTRHPLRRPPRPIVEPAVNRAAAQHNLLPLIVLPHSAACCAAQYSLLPHTQAEASGKREAILASREKFRAER